MNSMSCSVVEIIENLYIENIELNKEISKLRQILHDITLVNEIEDEPMDISCNEMEYEELMDTSQ